MGQCHLPWARLGSLVLPARSSAIRVTQGPHMSHGAACPVCVWSVPHSSPDRQLNWLCRITCPLRSVTTCPIVSTSGPLVACQSGAVSTCTPFQSACPCIGGTCVHGRSAHIHTNSTEQRLAPTGGGHIVCVGGLMSKEVDMNMKCYGWAHYHALLLN